MTSQAQKIDCRVFVGKKIRFFRNRLFQQNRILDNQVISTTGFEHRGRPKERATTSLPCGVMDRDSTGEIPSVMCPRQATGYPI